MSIQYGNIGVIQDFPIPKVILYIMSVKTYEKENIILTNPSEVLSIISERKCTHIMFHLLGLPRRAVEVGKAEKYLERLFK